VRGRCDTPADLPQRARLGRDLHGADSSFEPDRAGLDTLDRVVGEGANAALGEKGRKAIGITDGLVRISVGIEDVDDIVADLDQALSVI